MFERKWKWELKTFVLVKEELSFGWNPWTKVCKMAVTFTQRFNQTPFLLVHSPTLCSRILCLACKLYTDARLNQWNKNENMSHFIVQIKYKLLYKSYLLVPSLSAVWWGWGGYYSKIQLFPLELMELVITRGNHRLCTGVRLCSNPLTAFKLRCCSWFYSLLFLCRDLWLGWHRLVFSLVHEVNLRLNVLACTYCNRICSSVLQRLLESLSPRMKHEKGVSVSAHSA